MTTLSEPLSECCQMPALGEIIDGWSICQECHEHAEFIEEDEQDQAKCMTEPEQEQNHE